ncbi:HD-GYP domain-containing protein [Methylovorus menthalis]|uniref:HD-GYP domain-containing protein n=1 Tax=Methylovorus menthalis TaxID=1002227 RepID=UPI001E3D33F0|nr:HD-GYP domain-containing protein [Methylovorus menthalis]MCB4810437.1 HD-GYP domain-containing protein [Methylovorus menthalis]
MNPQQNHFIDVNQLRVGLYVHLDLGWMDHPFTFSNFKLKDEEQIATIKKVGLKRLRYDPHRSDCDPLPLPEPIRSPRGPLVEPPVEPIAETAHHDRHQPDPAQRLQQLQHALDESEKKFLAAANVAKQVTRNILTQTQTSMQQANTLIEGMVDSVLGESDVAIYAMSGNRSGDEHFNHPLNVTTLALMLSKSMDMTEEQARILGLAALFHDIGKIEIPNRLLMKTEPLTKAEQSFMEQHSEIGARIAKQCGMSAEVVELILHHHECADGTGYPKRLKQNDTSLLARLLAIVNVYDNLCNPALTVKALTPYEALAYMFAHQRSKFDESLLKRLIKCLGVYPPGSVVQLSTGLHGIVVSVNMDKPLRPFVMVHDPASQTEESQLIDLRDDPSLNISLCLKPSQLPDDAMEFLKPRKRLSYFISKDNQIAG